MQKDRTKYGRRNFERLYLYRVRIKANKKKRKKRGKSEGWIK